MNSDIQTDLDASETNYPIRAMIKPLAVAKYTKYYRKQKCIGQLNNTERAERLQRNVMDETPS